MPEGWDIRQQEALVRALQKVGMELELIRRALETRSNPPGSGRSSG